MPDFDVVQVGTPPRLGCDRKRSSRTLVSEIKFFLTSSFERALSFVAMQKETREGRGRLDNPALDAMLEAVFGSEENAPRLRVKQELAKAMNLLGLRDQDRIEYAGFHELEGRLDCTGKTMISKAAFVGLVLEFITNRSIRAGVDVVTVLNHMKRACFPPPYDAESMGSRVSHFEPTTLGARGT